MLEIKIRQNEEDILKKQFAACKCYDIAGSLEIISFCSCVINVLVSYWFPDESCLIYVTTVLIFIEGMCDYFKSYLISKGAQIRNNIDRTLFGLFHSSELNAFCYSKITENIDRICHLYKKKFEERKKCDGIQKGVKDWYILSNNYTDALHSIYDCQKQNQEFDTPIVRWNKFFIVIIFIGTIITIFTSRNIPLSLCVSLPLISKIIKNIILMVQHNNVIVAMKLICSQVDKGEMSKEKLEELQSYIEKRRCMDFSTFSVVYNLYRKYLHRITERAVNTKKSI